MSAIIDTSALIGLTDPTDEWREWAETEFNRLKANGPVILLDIVYAETSVGMADQSAMDASLLLLGLQRYLNKDEALFRASRAMRLYKERRDRAKMTDNAEVAKRVLPDMLIGAVAEIENIPILTANAADFKSYFPTIEIISPPPKPK